MENTNIINNSEIIQDGEDQAQVRGSKNDKKIESHRAAAAHLEAAAIHHLEAAKYYGIGDNEKADQSAFYAQGHHTMAAEYVKEDMLYMD